MKQKSFALVFIAAAIVLALAGSAGAVDGVIEINQAKVLAAGGFPFFITTGGSYRLTSNLTVPAGKVGIQDSAGGYGQCHHRLEWILDNRARHRQRG
jgi:hypothetical protein